MPKSFLIKKKQRRKHHSARCDDARSPLKAARLGGIRLQGAAGTPPPPLGAAVRKVLLLQAEDLGSDAENVPPSPSSPSPAEAAASFRRFDAFPNCKYHTDNFK